VAPDNQGTTGIQGATGAGIQGVTGLAPTGIAYLSVAQTFTASQRCDVTTLTSASASIAIDLDDNNNFEHTLWENTTLAAPSNATVGQSGVIYFVQDGDGGNTLAFNSFWMFPGGVTPTVGSAGAAKNLFVYYVVDETFAICQLLTNAS